MKRKKLVIDGLTLSYVEHRPTSTQSIFFIHGNSVSSATWRKQFADARFAEYRLVAFDLPGHGESEASKFPERDYNLIRLAEICTKSLRALVRPHEQFVVVGMSLGANIVAEMVAFGIHPNGIVLIGPSIVGKEHPYKLADIVVEGGDVSAVFADGVPLEEICNYALRASFSQSPEDLAIFLSEYHRASAPFRSTFFASVEAGQYSDELALLRETGLPVCVIMGCEEKVVNPFYLDEAPFDLWQGKVHRIPSASHLAQVDHPEAVNALLLQYADERLGSNNS